jgi:uncharacterized protein (TIGR03790 family)
LTAAWIGIVSLLAFAAPAAAQSAENVAVVINENSAASQLVGDYYVQKRQIPASNVFRIRTVPEETVTRQQYAVTIEAPIADAITREGLHDRILYLVLTKGVPLRISGTSGREGTVGSVDSELTLLYRRMTRRAASIAGFVDNPYFAGSAGIGNARRFSHRDYDIFLVSRLDAFTPLEVMSLIDAGLAPAAGGDIVLDQRAALVNRMGDDALGLAAQKLQSEGHGDRVRLETTPAAAQDTSPVLGYFSWGSTDPQLRGRAVGLRFVRGSLAATFAGADARTFQPPPPDWRPMSNPNNRATWFGGSPQSLIGDLIREGATGASGSVAEPFVEGIVRPEVLFSAYLAGFNLIESFYLAMPYLSWQTVVIGDPLCAPFTRQTLTRNDIEEPVDPATEAPRLFGARWMEALRGSMNIDEVGAQHMLRAEMRLRRGDTAGGRKALEEAASSSPKLSAPILQLALLDEQAGARDEAIGRYRQILDIEPNNAIVLNNLAYSLAVHKGQAAEAKPFADRAVAMSRRNPTIVDTLGWIEYLLGNNTPAYQLLTEAAKGAPFNPEIRLHAALAAASMNRFVEAEVHLKEALRRMPAYEEREDVQALRRRLAR